MAVFAVTKCAGTEFHNCRGADGRDVDPAAENQKVIRRPSRLGATIDGDLVDDDGRVGSLRGVSAEDGFFNCNPFTDHFEEQSLRGPADASEQFIERRGRTLAVQLQAVKSACEIEQLTIDLPATALHIVAGHNKGTVQLKDHPRPLLKSGGHVFPGAGKRRA
jgi:hypothetical protein